MSARVVVSDQKAIDLEIEREVLSDATLIFERATTEQAVLEATDGADALIVDGYTPVTARVLDQRPNLDVVARAGIGTDNIDLEAATRNDVQVINVPSYCADEVATHALALLLGATRKIHQYDESVRNGIWDWEAAKPVYRLRGSTLGLVGFGTIARQLADRVRGFDLEVIAYSPRTPSDQMAEYDVEKVDFDQLVDRSDLCSIHVPLTSETENLFDRDVFARMQDNAVLVNTARGGVVDEEALNDALASDEIGGAGLDVLEEEPPESSALLDRNDVILTPHVGWYSEEGLGEVRRRAAEQIRQVLRGRQPENPVNTV